MPTNLTTIIGTAAAGAAITSINWTAVIAILTISFTAMGTLIKLFGPKGKINDENLRSSPYLKQLEVDVKDKETKFTQLKELINTQHIDLAKLKVKAEHGTKSLEDLKQDNRDLVQRLDDLLKQFMEYMES